MEVPLLFLVLHYFIGHVNALDPADFTIHNSLTTYNDARLQCEKEAKKLLRIENSNKWADLLAMTDYHTFLTSETYWIGLRTYSVVCDSYTWGGFDPVCPWTNWGTDQPANCAFHQCGKAVAGKWATASCFFDKQIFMCEKIQPDMCTGSNGGTRIDPETTTEETTTTSTTTAAMAATTTTSEATTTTALTTIATTETTVVSTEGAATTALTNTATTESLATTVGTNIREPSPTITPVPTTTTKTPISARETTTKKSSELSSVKSNRELPTTSSSSEGLTDTVVRVIETTSVSGDVEPTTAQTETSQNSSSQGEIGWFEEYQGTTIAETHLVSSVASPVALRTTGTMETCQQTCLTTMMNTFQCWAVTIPDPSSDECILYYIDSVSNLRAPSVMVALAGAILLLKLQDSNPVSGLPCACRLDFNWDLPPNVSREEMLEMLQETLDQLKGELSVKKNETQKYQRTLISAEDNRTSAVGLGSMGVALLVTVFGFVVVADIPYLVALFNFFKRRYNRKINNAPS